MQFLTDNKSQQKYSKTGVPIVSDSSGTSANKSADCKHDQDSSASTITKEDLLVSRFVRVHYDPQYVTISQALQEINAEYDCAQRTMIEALRNKQGLFTWLNGDKYTTHCLVCKGRIFCEVLSSICSANKCRLINAGFKPHECTTKNTKLYHRCISCHVYYTNDDKQPCKECREV